MRLCTCWSKIFESRTEDERHHAHETILEYVQKAPDDIHWEIDKREFDEMIAAKKESSPGPDGFQKVSTGVRVGWGLTSCLTLLNVCMRVALCPYASLRAGPFSFPKSYAVRPLTLCDCDCKIITTAICFGLHRYSIRCIHRQMTDNIFEVETTTLAHVTCATCDSGVLLTEFAATDPGVNLTWIFHVLDKAELPRFICRFLWSINFNNTSEVEIAGETRGQFFLARGVRQGCPASGFPFAMAFDPFFRWLLDSIIPRNPAAPDFLQPSPCACADDCAVAASSFGTLMTALSPAIVVVDRVAGLNLNRQNCCWVQHGSDSCHELLDWVSTNCEEFREMKIVKYGEYVGTMLGPEGYLHRWTAPRKKFIQRTGKINGPSKSLFYATD